jgi:hypothetical protein
MKKLKRTWFVQVVAMVCVLTMGSTAMAPEARAMGTVRAGLEFYQAHSVEISCFIGVGNLVLTGNPRGAIKCIINILVSAGGGSGKPGAQAQTIVFHSVDEYLASPKVPSKEKELVRRRYLPAIKRVEAEIYSQAMLASKKMKGKKVSEALAEQQVRTAVMPLIDEATSSLVANGVKVIVK